MVDFVIGRFARRKPLGALGAVIIVLLCVVALLARFIAPYDPIKTDYVHLLQPPQFDHWMGTDSFGRDILSRVIYGAQTAMLIGFSTSLIGSLVGLFIGVISAYFGGNVDLLLQRVMDVLLSFPIIILALTVVAVLGTGSFNLVVAISIPMIPRVARVVRASALAVRSTLYVEAAVALGARHGRIILQHMLPNVLAPFLIMLTSLLGQAILLEASLSFIGLGVAEPTPAWGLMLRGAAIDFAERAPWMAIFPGLAISVAVFSFNIFGDSLRDELDPKL